MNYKILISICIGLMILIGTASAYTVTRITTNAADQTNPSIYNKYIVWQDTRNGGSDIYLRNLGTQVQTRVTKGVDAEHPYVSGNRIVWQDKRNGNWDIYMYNISTKKTSRITTNTADQTDPSIYGNLIVWADTRNGGSSIYLQNLATKVQTRLTTNGTSPSIFGNRIIWNSETNEGEGFVIMLYDLATKKASPIYFDIDPYSVSISGNRIIYNDMFNGMFTGMYDIGTKKHINLPFPYVSDPKF